MEPQVKNRKIDECDHRHDHNYSAPVTGLTQEVLDFCNVDRSTSKDACDTGMD